MRELVVCLLLIAGLSACDETGETPEERQARQSDPRQGRVVEYGPGCILGKHCFIDTKVCVGPDLLVVLDVEGSATQRWAKDSEECKP